MAFQSSITNWSNTENYNLRLQQYMKAVEGEVLPAYVDTVGVPTIGWGFALGGKHAIPKFVDYFIRNYLNVNNSGLLDSNTPVTAHLSDSAAKAEADFYKKLKGVLNQHWPADNTIEHSKSSVDLQKALNKILNDRISMMNKLFFSPYDRNDILLIGAPVKSFEFKSGTDISNNQRGQLRIIF